MDRWVGKVAIVTGASSGIGEAIAIELVKCGMKVLALARREEKLKKLSKDLETSKGKFYYMRCDVLIEQDILKAFEFAEKNLGGVDVLVNNAGISKMGSIAETSTEDLRSVLDINLLAATICSREALNSIRRLKKSEAHIFNINSVLGFTAVLKSTQINVYSASKFGMRAMAEVLRQEIFINKDPIRLTSIHPGLVMTEIIGRSGLNVEEFSKLPHLQSKDIADAVIYCLGAPSNVQIEVMKITPLHESLE